MTAVEVEDVTEDASPAAERARPIPFVTMLGAVSLVAAIPFLNAREFYLAGDTIGQWLPVNRRMGELLLDGESHLMDPTMWRGGNFVAEARFGLWNPLTLLLDVTIVRLDDLAVAMLLVTLVYLTLLSTGVYLLAREYGADAWPSSVAGVVAATGGWVLWMDAAWWTPHLASLAFTPFVWIAARRVARRVSGPIWLVISGALCVSAGNPYGNVVVFLIVVGVALEFGARRRPAPLLALFGALVSIGLIAIFVYLPFQRTSGVGPRDTGVFNDGSWVLGTGDLLTSSSPTATPRVLNFGRPTLGFPGAYLSWFLLPLAPWFRWRALVERRFAALAVILGAFLVLSIGPSNFWFFRWPMRLIPYLHLPVIIAVAVLLAAGLATTHRRRRASASIAIVAFGTYLAWAETPDDRNWHVAVGLLVAALVVGAIAVAVRRPDLLGPALIAGTVIVLVAQVQWQPLNQSVRYFGMPERASTFEANFGDRYEGLTVQIASPDAVPAAERTPDGAYRHITLLSTHSFADVETVSTYSGIGFTTHDTTLCLRFDGAMCGALWERLWEPAPGTDRVLADLLGVDTVVAQRTVVDTSAGPAPPGWELVDSNETADVWARIETRPWPDGRLTDVVGPIEAVENVEERAHREIVTVRRSANGPAQLTFARLAWPGYEATLNGRVLPVGGGPAGLLTVSIPADAGEGDVVVTWVPPYWRPSLAALALGVLLGAGTQIWWMRRRRAEP